MARDNKSLGNFNLDGIPPAPRGVPQIEVTFDIDANGILNVTAKDLGTQKEQKITITAAGGLSKEEIEKMRKDAEAHAAEDEKRHAEVEARNKADGLAFQVEKTLKDAGDKIAADKKKPVEDALKALKDELAKTPPAPIADIKAKEEALMKAMEPVAQEMYASPIRRLPSMRAFGPHFQLSAGASAAPIRGPPRIAAAATAIIAKDLLFIGCSYRISPGRRRNRRVPS